jgi:lysine 2,3-aminomutase
LVVAVHFNHPKEITPYSTEAIRKLGTCTQALLNQSVLLKGVNDDWETLKALSEGLFEMAAITVRFS